ncbi:MAG: hypothetical protein CMH57_11910 [Myxococcales bacterium]|nr:hypothetical protein [Myxococcales bacterium]
MSMVERPTVRHLAARTHPEIYRPLVDAALLRVGEFCGADLRGLQRALAPIEVERGGGRLSLGPWGYVEEALCRARPLVMGARLREALGCGWFTYFMEGGADRYEGHALIEDAGALSMDADVWGVPLFLEAYPEEAWPFLRQQAYVGGFDEDVVGLWRRPGGYSSLCHAHPEGFWVLGYDAVDFVERAAARLDWVEAGDQSLGGAALLSA